jgi:ABC-type transport system involved in cytochrome c biogenesis permease subunit
MQDVSIFWLRVAAAFYFPGLLAAVFSLSRRRPLVFRPALFLFGIAALLHFVSLVDLARQTKRFPAETFYESISLCAFLLAVLFLFVNWRYKFASLSTFIFPLVAVMTLVGATSAPVAPWTDPRVRNAWLLLHVTLAIAGYAALVVAAAASLFYIVQERRLKRKQTSDRLPPLATLDDVLSRSMALGFILITLAVVMGSVWGFIESGTAWIADPKIVVAWVTWLGYLTIVFLRVSAGWRGRKAALMTIGVLGFSALTWATHIGIRSELTR